MSAPDYPIINYYTITTRKYRIDIDKKIKNVYTTNNKGKPRFVGISDIKGKLDCASFLQFYKVPQHTQL